MTEDSEQKRFTQLYKDYHRLVRNVLYNMVDEKVLDDLVQDAFLRIWRGLPRFAFRSSIKTWIYRITIHTALDHLRTLKIRPREAPLEDLQVVSDDQLQLPLNQHLVQQALQSLDENHRSVIILHFFEELDISQVAKVLEIPSGTVKSRIFTAKNRLKNLLSQEGQHYESV